MTPDNSFKTQAFIANRWLDGSDERHFDVLNPSTGELLARVVDCGAPDAKAAVEAADAALPGWRARTASERAAILMRWHALILEHKDRLARLISLEQGKVLAESEGEVAYGAAYIRWFAEEARRVYGTVIPEPVAGRRLIVVKEPVGVVAVITPWNFPFAMLARKIAPALAAGCTVVARPAEDTPLTALAIADLAEQAGFAPGVLNVIASSRDRVEEVSNVWMEAETVRKVSFTGSTQVGKAIAGRGAQTLKKLSLELGGNAPFIVFDDADIGAAVDGAIAAKFRNSGQTCVSPNRFIVQDTVYEEFAARLVERVRALTVGDAFSEGATIGPLINERALTKVERHIEDACALGARVMIGGRRSQCGTSFFEPTVVTEATTTMALANEETFGPVAALFRFKTEQEAIDLANETPYGLAAYFYARDVGRVWRVSRALEAGMVGINEAMISTEVAPFGGIKESGQGREGSYMGLDDYLEVKYLCMGGLGQ